MKILPVIENTCSNIKKASTRLSKAGRDGYHIALRTSKIHNQSDAATFVNIGKSITKKISKETKYIYYIKDFNKIITDINIGEMQQTIKIKNKDLKKVLRY